MILHRWLASLLLFFSCSTIACQLTASTPSTQFGSVSSFTVSSTQQQSSAQPHAGITCDFSTLVSLLSDDYVSVTFTSINGGQMTTQGDASSVINYQIFGDSSLSEEYVFGQLYTFTDTDLLDLLGLFGDQVEFPLYARTGAGSNLSAGIYTDQIMASWNWNYCKGVGLPGVCIMRTEGSAQSTITVELEVTPDCMITAPDIDFGSSPLVAGFDPVSQVISLTCTKNSSFTIGLNDGVNASGGQRRMAFDSNYLEYEIYKSSSTERWGSAGAERREQSDVDTGDAIPDGITPQNYNYRAQIMTSQNTPPAGTYTDSIIVDVQF
ncbi:Csu type fimbrial protein [Vibrio parahaemolyticus]|uniref:Csu type fimbrial protein n=1 Tax=Vibrio parahaemolyticus TaxID=670 RepID=UPI0011237E7E|nr:spore coat U domain-containing protein [Vibrio parahaemolyticus]TOD99473.1 protein CsuE [Vibrio parahaemolyticus]